MHFDPMVRVADALVTALLALIAATGVALAWALGHLPELVVALAIVALAAPRIHRAFG